MTISLDLKPEEESILTAQAESQGVDMMTVLRRAIAQMQMPKLSPLSPVAQEDSGKHQAAIALLQSWIEEDDDMTDDERGEADRDLEQFKANINRWRTEEGRASLRR